MNLTRSQKVGLFIALTALAAAVLIFVPLTHWRRWFTGQRPVVVYTSVDPEYALALRDRFTQETGLAVDLRTDTEGVKTTGMIGRLRELKSHPDGDVFWNSELSGTLLLAHEGVLAPYQSPQTANIPARYKDPKERWTGFGLRARVLIYNTQFVKAEEAPQSVEQLTDPKWRGRFCLAKPLFGTTRSHLVSLVLALGEERGLDLLRRLRENGSAGGTRQFLLPGNAAVRERVADGTFHLGLTDTDDVYVALDRKRPVGMVWLSQAAAWPGVYLIPNSVGLIDGGPNPEGGRKFIDFLLRPETEAWLAEQGARQIPVREAVPVPAGFRTLASLQEAVVDYSALCAKLEPLSERINAILSGREP